MIINVFITMDVDVNLESTFSLPVVLAAPLLSERRDEGTPDTESYTESATDADAEAEAAIEDPPITA